MMPLARMQQPPVAVSTTSSSTDATLKSVSELISAAAAASNSLTSNRLHLTGSTSPPSIMSASSSSSSSSSTSSSPKSVPSSMASVSSPPSSSVSPDVVASSTSPVTHQASSSVSPPHTSHAAVAAVAAAAVASSAQILSAEMMNPLRELNNYLARIEEEKCSLREENEKLNDVREKLNMDLVTYSRFNCILECMKRSLKNALGAIECIDQNKACRCNEHLNVNLRQIVQESKIEISLWQQKYESLVYKFHTEYENFHRMGSLLSVDENPLRHMNAALMGHNGTLLSIPEVPERNGFREPTPVTSASTPNGNSEKLTNGSATDLSSSNGNRAQTPANNASPALTNGYSAHKPTSGEAPPPGPSEKGSVLKTSLDLATTINFSPASFLTNDANNNTAKPANRGKEDEECHTPPPLIPAPPPTSTPNNNNSSTPNGGVTSAQELISIDLAKRINSGDMSGFWRLNKYPVSPNSPPPQATTVNQVKNTNGFSTPDIELKAEMRSLSRLGDKHEEKQLGNSPTIHDGAHQLKKEHKAEHHLNGDDEKIKVEKFKCDWPDCNQLLDSDEILTQHRRCHIRKSNYQCRYCSARMLSREDLEDHEIRCEKSERKLSKIHASPEPETIISKRKREILEREESLSSIGSGGSRSCSPKMVIDERQRKVDSGHSSEEEIEVEEIASRVARPEPTSTDRLFLHQLGKERESPKNSMSSFDSFDARQREAAEALDLVRYSELFHPNKRQKAFTISTPSPYNLSSHNLASSALSAFYPALSSNAGGNTGLPQSLLGPAPGAPAPNGTAATMDLAALVESGRISPLTLSMLAQQRENQQRFQHYFAAAAAQHHLNQQSVTPVSAASPIQPPPSAQSPNTAENLSARSSSFSSATSPFYHQRTSSVSGLMAPPSGASSSSSKPALSPVSQASTERERASSPGLSFGSHSATSPLFSPPAGRSYTISTPNSFSALAALAAAATSSAANNNAAAAACAAAAAVNGLPKPPPQNVSLTSSDLQSQKSSFLSGFDFRSNGLGPSPLSSPPGAGALKTSQLGGYNPYGQPPVARSIGIPPHQPTVITPSPVELLSGSRAQTSLMMAAAAAAAAEGRPCMPNHGVSPASEASRITAAALASLGALKHHQSTGTPMGEYKRTRYSGIGRYRCPWPDCGYTPHFLRDLRRHMFKHTGDKKHKCDYPGCDFVSVWKTSLLQHQRKKHYGVSSSIPLRTNNHHSSAGSENRPARNENGTVLAGAI